MPRARRSAARPSPAAAPRREAHTMAAPPPAAHSAPAHTPSVAQPQQPGLFAQMAATAGGVAVGSAIGHTVGHAVTGLFGGSSSESSAPPQQQTYEQTAPQTTAFDQSSAYTQQSVRSCDADAKAFTRCLESTNNDMTSCQYYLDMLKQCQAFASSQTH